MTGMGKKLCGAMLLAALIVPSNAHAAAGCQANPEFTSCNYIAGGGDINYVGVDPAGASITIFRDYASAPGTGCPKWSSTNTSCLIFSLVLSNISHGASPIRQGAITTFKNAADFPSPRIIFA